MEGVQGVVIFIVLIYLGIIFAGQKKARQEAEKRKAESARRQAEAARSGVRPAQYAPRTAQTSYQAARQNPQASARAAAPVRVSAVFDETHYHREGYDFATCFSFKDVPPGADELSALIRANSRHERELEKLMHTSDQS